MTESFPFTLLHLDPEYIKSSGYLDSNTKNNQHPQFCAFLHHGESQEFELVIGALDATDKFKQNDSDGNTVLNLPTTFQELLRFTPVDLVSQMTSSHPVPDNSDSLSSSRILWEEPSMRVEEANKAMIKHGFSPIIACSKVNTQLIVGIHPYSQTQPQSCIVKPPSQAVSDHILRDTLGWEYHGYSVTSVVLDIRYLMKNIVNSWSSELHKFRTDIDISTIRQSVRITGFITVPQFTLTNVYNDSNDDSTITKSNSPSNASSHCDTKPCISNNKTTRKDLIKLFQDNVFPNARIKTFSIDSDGVRFVTFTSGLEKVLCFYSLLDCLEHEELYKEKIEIWENEISSIISAWESSIVGEDLLGTEFGGKLYQTDLSDSSDDELEDSKLTNQTILPNEQIEKDDETLSHPIMSSPSFSNPEHPPESQIVSTAGSYFHSFQLPEGFPSHIFLPPKPLHQPVILQPVWNEIMGKSPSYLPYPLSWYLSCPFSALPKIGSEPHIPSHFSHLLFDNDKEGAYPYSNIHETLKAPKTPSRFLFSHTQDEECTSSDILQNNHSSTSIDSVPSVKVDGFEENLEDLFGNDGDIYHIDDHGNPQNINGDEHILSDIGPKYVISPPERYNYEIFGDILDILWLDPFSSLDGAIYRLINQLEAIGQPTAEILDNFLSILDEDSHLSRCFLICEYAVVDVELSMTYYPDDSWWMSISDAISSIPSIVSTPIIPLDHSLFSRKSGNGVRKLTSEHIIIPRIQYYRTGTKFSPETGTNSWNWFTGIEPRSCMLLGTRNGRIFRLFPNINPLMFQSLCPVIETTKTKFIQILSDIVSHMSANLNQVGSVTSKKNTSKSRSGSQTKISTSASQLSLHTSTSKNSKITNNLPKKKSENLNYQISEELFNQYDSLIILLDNLKKSKPFTLDGISCLKGISGIPFPPSILDPSKILETDQSLNKFDQNNNPNMNSFYPVDTIKFQLGYEYLNTLHNNTSIAWIQTVPSSPLVWFGFNNGMWALCFIDSATTADIFPIGSHTHSSISHKTKNKTSPSQLIHTRLHSNSVHSPILARVVQQGSFTSPDALEISSNQSNNSQFQTYQPPLRWKSFCFDPHSFSSYNSFPFKALPTFEEFSKKPFLTQLIQTVSISSKYLFCGLLGTAEIDQVKVLPTDYLFLPHSNSTSGYIGSDEIHAISFQKDPNLPDRTLNETQIQTKTTNHISQGVQDIPSSKIVLHKNNTNLFLPNSGNPISSISATSSTTEHDSPLDYSHVSPDILAQLQDFRSRFREVWVNNHVQWNLLPESISNDLKQGKFEKYTNWMIPIPSTFWSVGTHLLNQQNSSEENSFSPDSKENQPNPDENSSIQNTPDNYISHLKQEICALLLPLEEFVIDPERWDYMKELNKEKTRQIALEILSENIHTVQWMKKVFLKYYKCYITPPKAIKPILHSMSMRIENFPIEKSAPNFVPTHSWKDIVNSSKNQHLASSVLDRIFEIHYANHIYGIKTPSLGINRTETKPILSNKLSNQSILFKAHPSILPSNFNQQTSNNNTVTQNYPSLSWLSEKPGESTDNWTNYAFSFLNDDSDNQSVQTRFAQLSSLLSDQWCQELWEASSHNFLDSVLSVSFSTTTHSSYPFDKSTILKTPIAKDITLLFYLPHQLDTVPKLQFQWTMLSNTITTLKQTFNQKFNMILKYKTAILDRIKTRNSQIRGFYDSISHIWEIIYFERCEHVKQIARTYSKIIEAFPTSTSDETNETVRSLSEKYPPFLTTWPLSTSVDYWQSILNTPNPAFPTPNRSIPASGTSKETGTPNSEEREKIMLKAQAEARIPFPRWKLFDLIPTDITIDEDPNILSHCLDDLSTTFSDLEKQITSDGHISDSLSSMQISSDTAPTEPKKIDPNVIHGSGISQRDTERALITMMQGRLDSDDQSDQLLHMIYLPQWMCAPGIPIKLEGDMSNSSLVEPTPVSEKLFASFMVFIRQCEDSDPGEELIFPEKFSQGYANYSPPKNFDILDPNFVPETASEIRHYLENFWKIHQQLLEQTRLQKLSQIERGEDVSYEPHELKPQNELPTCIWDSLANQVLDTMTPKTFAKLKASYISAAAGTSLPVSPPNNIEEQALLLHRFSNQWVQRHKSRLMRISHLCKKMLEYHRRNIADLTLFNSLYLDSLFNLRSWTNFKVLQLSSRLNAITQKLFITSRQHPVVLPTQVPVFDKNISFNMVGSSYDDLKSEITHIEGNSPAKPSQSTRLINSFSNSDIQILVSSRSFKEPDLPEIWDSLSKVVASNTMFQLSNTQVTNLRNWLKFALVVYSPIAEYKISLCENKCSNIRISIKSITSELKSISKKKLKITKGLNQSLFAVLSHSFEMWYHILEKQNSFHSDIQNVQNFPLPEPPESFSNDLSHTWTMYHSLGRLNHTLNLKLLFTQKLLKKSLKTLNFRIQEKKSLDSIISTGFSILESIQTTINNQEKPHFLYALQDGQSYSSNFAFSPLIANSFVPKLPKSSIPNKNVGIFRNNNPLTSFKSFSLVDQNFTELAFLTQSLHQDSENSKDSTKHHPKSLILIPQNSLQNYNQSQLEKQSRYQQLLDSYFTSLKSLRQLKIDIFSLRNTRTEFEQLKHDLHSLKVTKIIQSVAHGNTKNLSHKNKKTRPNSSSNDSIKANSTAETGVIIPKSDPMLEKLKKKIQIQKQIVHEQEELENAKHTLRMFWAEHPETMSISIEMKTPQQREVYLKNKAEDMQRLLSVSSYQKKTISNLKQQLIQMGIKVD